MANETDRETDWAEKIGKPAASSLREMVAALECDYERLEELRDEREALVDAMEDVRQASHDAQTELEECPHEAEEPSETLFKERDAVVKAFDDARNALDEWDENNEEELKELEDAAKPCGNECKDRDDAEQMIHEDPLSVQVRSDWVSVGETMTAGEFEILLTTGGPAVRIMGELDEHGEPYRAWLEVQDWGKCWTHYYEPGLTDVLLTYARCFCFSR